MTNQCFEPGLDGLQPGRSWAAKAHARELRASSVGFGIVGVTNINPETGEKATAGIGLDAVALYRITAATEAAAKSRHRSVP